VVPAQLGALNTSLARVIGGGEPGSGVVELVDQNVAPEEMVKTLTAGLNVVIPASLELIFLPRNSLDQQGGGAEGWHLGQGGKRGAP